MLEGGGIITPPGPGVPAWNGLEAIFPALNAAAVMFCLKWSSHHINGKAFITILL
jgi:hypothetical protein